jgi:P-loop containing dynein motor region D4
MFLLYYFRIYRDMGGYNEVREIFSTLLEEYGQQVKKMTLVLFEAALEHLCRIHRIIRNPRGVCFVMLCCAMLHYVMLCSIMLSCFVVSYQITLSCMKIFHTVSFLPL